MADTSSSSSDDERYNDDVEKLDDVKTSDDEDSEEDNDDRGNNNKDTVVGHLIPEAQELRDAGLVSKYARLDGDTSFSSREPKYPITLEWRHINYKVVLRLPPNNFFLRWMLKLPIPEMFAKYLRVKKEIPILNDLSGKVEAGKMVAIMGPTGSGKTTLLNVLARRVKMNVTGDILHNGEKIRGRRLKRRMAYVLQDDVFFSQITVRSTLATTAHLTLPRKLGFKEKSRRVEEVISELGLGRCSNTIIGGPFMRGVSGGERKRTNIANEIIKNASLIFLDEPTTGLDAATSMGLIVTMKNLARSGHTVVTTIHQPSSAMFMLFDHVVLLAEGGYTVYSGPAREVLNYFASLGLHSPSNYNPADFMLEVVSTKQNVEDGRSVKQYLIDSYKERHPQPEEDEASDSDSSIRASREDKEQEGKAAVKDMKKGPKWPSPFWLQTWVLGLRCFKQRRGDLINWLHTFQLLFIAVLVGLLWFDMDYDEESIPDRTGLLFFNALFWSVHSWMNALQSFAPERAVLNKERAAGQYRLSAYFIGKTIAEAPLELVLPFFANTILYWMTNLSRDGYTYILYLVLTWLMVLMGASIGILLSAYFVQINKGITVSIILILGSTLLGGFFVSRDNLHVWISWARWLSFIKYAYESLLINELKLAKDVTFTPLAKNSAYDSNPITGQDVLDRYGVETTIWGDVIFLVGMIIVARILAYLCLRFLNKVKQ